jgi:hypothetical protein
MGKGIWPALGAAVLLGLAPSASAATVRYASPTGDNSTSNCTAAEPPCSLKRAVETVAMPGDEVILAPGLYEPPSQVTINKAIDVRGEAGQPHPRVVRSAGGVFSVGGGGTLADMQVEAPGSVLNVSSVAERVTVLAGPAAGGVAVRVTDGGVLRDSLVRTEATNGHAVDASFGVIHLVNVTALATDAGSTALYTESTIGGICFPTSYVELHATNVIARGGLNDVWVRHLCGGSTSGTPTDPHETAHMSHSNFRRAKVNETRPDSRLEDEGGNQEVEPLFAAPASLDFHQLAGSPTIDAGAATPLLGARDIDGQPRTQGSAPDIGADEFVPPEPPVIEPTVDMRRPVASLLRVTPGRFRAAAARATRRRAGARISYALDETAKVTFTIKRIITRVVRGKKRAGYRPLRGSFSDAGEVGGNTLRFSGRLRGRKLRPGLYRLIALPVDAAGNTGNAVYVRFRIVR